MFKISIIKDGNQIAYITYGINYRTLDIYTLYVYDDYRRNGYGYGLIISCLYDIIKKQDNSYFITKIKLDDCSSFMLTKRSIYYKFGFRIIDKSNIELMQFRFLKPKLSSYKKRRYYLYEDETEPSTIYYKTIIDLYSNVLSTARYIKIIKNINDKILSNEISLCMYKYNTQTSNFELGDFDFTDCLNISYEIAANKRKLRSNT